MKIIFLVVGIISFSGLGYAADKPGDDDGIQKNLAILNLVDDEDGEEVRLILTELNFTPYVVNYFWYCQKHKIKDLKAAFGLTDVLFLKRQAKKPAASSNSPSPSNDSIKPNVLNDADTYNSPRYENRDFMIVLKGEVGKVNQALAQLAIMTNRLVFVSKKIRFQREVWKSLRQKQQHYANQQDGHMIMTLLPSRQADDITITFITEKQYENEAKEQLEKACLK